MSCDWLDKLNPAQREAATWPAGPLLIVAGAGTGKTNTLACRVAHLIAQGAAPQRILLLTFTRRAAREMIHRAGQYVGGKTADATWGGTFHAIGNRLLRIFGQAAGLTPAFTVLDQSDGADVINMVRNELGLASRERRFPKKATLMRIYSRTVSAQCPLAEVLETYFPWCAREAEDISRIFDAYTDRKRRQNLLDYDDLLLYWRLLCDAGETGQRVTSLFDHILVDEYQDTNTMQAGILRAMRRDNNNICVVGDDAQSIYSFRSATVRNILDFPEHFPDTHVVTLEQNYRSVQPILDASNAVMVPAVNRYTKNLWSQRRSSRRPVLVHCVNEDDQCASVCRNVLSHLEQDIPLMRQAVLFRAGWHSDRLEVELSHRRIPFRKFGGLKFVETGHIKDMMAVLRILENPRDEVSWYRVLMLMHGVGPKTARRILDALGGAHEQPAEKHTPNAPNNSSGLNNSRAPGNNAAATESPAHADSVMSPVWRLVHQPPPLPAPIREQMDSLRRTLAECCGIALTDEDRVRKTTQHRAVPLAEQIVFIRRFYGPLFEDRYDNAPLRLQDIEQLEHIASGYRSRASFLADLTLDPPDTASDLAGPPHLDEDYLTLSTVHSAKGCEWDAVHIIHAAEGMFPSDMAVTDDAGVDEERRLFYVAMTRARDFLYVYFPLRYYYRRKGNTDQYGLARLTRFMTDEVRQLFEHCRPDSDTAPEDVPDMDSSATADLDAFLKRLWSR